VTKLWIMNPKFKNTSYIIDHFPFRFAYYASRGFLYYHQGNYEASLLDYSIALLLVPEDQFIISDYYYSRARCNLALGEILEAQLQLHKAMDVPSRFTNINIPEHKSKLHNSFCKDCIKQGTRHYESGNFYMAEKIFSLGFIKSPSAALCYHAALALGVQNEYDKAIEKLKVAKQIVNTDKKLLSDIKYMLQVFEDKKAQLEKQKRDQFRTASRLLHKEQTQQIAALAPPPAVSEKTKSKHRHKKPATILISTPVPIKKQSSTSEIQAVLNEETKLDEIASSLLENEDEKEIKKKEDLDELQRKKRNERKKIRRKQRRAQTAGKENPDESSDEDKDIHENLPALEISLPKPVVTSDVTQLELLDIEKLIFAFFKDRLPVDNEYLFYMVGGWAYDRVRHILCNVPLPDYYDIDLICDIPPEVLRTTFPVLKEVPEVENLFVLTIGGHKIDLVYRPYLKNLYTDAKSRDFLTIYISDKGVIQDPTGFGIINMRANKLKSVTIVSELFQRDPLTMLRAVYTCLKRNLIMTDVKHQIKKDNKLLVPTLDPANPQAPGLLHPARINITLKKNFSQKRALCNFNLLYELGVIDILFPQVITGIKNDIDWIRKQFKKSDEWPWPKLEIIYANFITTAIMTEVKNTLPVYCKNLSESIFYSSQVTLTREQFDSIQVNVEMAIITKIADEIFNQSLLFSTCYKTRDNLNRFLPAAINQWKEHWREIYMPRPPSSALPITDSNGKVIEGSANFSIR
jgi:tetratricopeptide (TPR) repeat protein